MNCGRGESSQYFWRDFLGSYATQSAVLDVSHHSIIIHECLQLELGYYQLFIKLGVLSVSQHCETIFSKCNNRPKMWQTQDTDFVQWFAQVLGELLYSYRHPTSVFDLWIFHDRSFEWLVMAAHHCHLWWRWWSDALWGTLTMLWLHSLSC